MEIMTNSTVKFNVGSGKKQKKVSFDVNHNLPEIPGMSLSDAVLNWAHRTDEYTAESLCAYINSKNTGHRCEPA